jgi:hypothetical protein
VRKREIGKKTGNGWGNGKPIEGVFVCSLSVFSRRGLRPHRFLWTRQCSDNVLCCAYGVHVVCMWCACGVHVVCIWCACGVHVVCMWCACGVHVVCMWCARGVHVVCMWCAYGVHVVCQMAVSFYLACISLFVCILEVLP